jgi:peptide/nickel transport system substrate-binding protein
MFFPSRAVATSSSRRQRKRGVLAALAVFPAVGLLAVVLTTLPANAASQSQKVVNGGTLTYLGEGLEWPTLDPASAAEQGPSQPIMSLIYGNLFNVGPNNTFTGDLAKSLTISPGGLSATLTLRPNISFQDGTPFNAAAVVTNLKRDSMPGSGCFCYTALKNITSVTAPSNLEVDITFSSPDGVLLATLATSGASFIVSPAALASQGSNYGQNPVGAGPYKVSSNVVDSTITLQRWPGYFDAKATHVDTIVITSEAAGTAGLAALQSGGAQILSLGNDPPTIKEASKDHALVQETEHLSANFEYMNFEKPPFNNILAREALQYATNAVALNRSLYEGYGPASETLTGPDQIAYPGSTLPGYRTYNLAKAKKLVAEVGGISFTQLTLGNTPFGIATAEALAKQWALAGIQATIDPLTLAGALALLESGNFQGVVAGYPAQQDTPLTLATSLVCPVLFSPGFCDQSVTSTVKQALETQKFNLQATLMKRAITQAVVGDASYVALNSTPFGIFLTKSAHGFGFYGGEIYLAGVSLS